MKRLQTSIRLKLTIASLVPLVVATTLCWVMGASIITTRIISQAQQKVETDLNSAREMLKSDLAHLSDGIRLTGLLPELVDALHDTPSYRPEAPLQVILRNEQLSFLTVVDRYGIVRYRAANPALAGDSLRNEKLISDALKGVIASGISVYSAEQVARENPRLPALMTIPIRSTPRARIYTRKIEDRGMFLVAAAPVKGPGGEISGVVYGGLLLNNANSLVDRITRVIFQRGEAPSTTSGSATLFLDDVRIATSLADSSGQRAGGTLMSEEVFGAITRGEKWIDRAFVLNDWHLSAYEPVRDYGGGVIGALYVGVPERPFLEIRSRINMIFSGVLLFVTLIGIALSAWLGRNLARPIKALEEGARRIGAGEQLPDISIDSSDEIARLATEFNAMKHRLTAREGDILALNRTLEDKVLDRTARLEEKSRQLLVAQKELAQAERLASIGQLASGVAHEINNPLAIIRGNAELLEMFAGADATNSDGVATIIKQADRIERIVSDLLTFSRSGIKRVTVFHLGELLDDILDQVGHQISLEGYTINRCYHTAAIMVEGDRDQLRQVFTNLVVNGLQAMKEGGLLVVDSAQDNVADQCRIIMADNGPGIAAELRKKLFTPFLTTKDEGTGLGLAISYGIVKDHGGEIRVESEEGCGAVFSVILPLRQQQDAKVV
ncbi:MAG TPA: cache domain-containing protein [Desulfuromonadaceae bacterium]|jgi:two-component system NtrC family sensor kinase